MSFTSRSIRGHPHARLIFVWSALDLLLLASGIITITASVCFHRPKQLIVNLILDRFHFICGLVLGSAYVVLSGLAVPAILLGRERLWGLKGLNYGLGALIIATLLFATWIWFFSLRQLQELCDIWEQQPAGVQQAIQDTWQCCGYWNGTAQGKFETVGGYCQSDIFAASQSGCVGIITSSHAPGTDYTLNNIFTCLYGWIAILSVFLLTTLCVIKERQVEVRFARIDEKRGGGGFV